MSLDFNAECVKQFYDKIKSDADDKELSGSIPRIRVTVRFENVGNDHYAKAIVGNWIKTENGNTFYEIQYNYQPKNEKDFLELTKKLIQTSDSNKNDLSLLIPAELYEYSIISTNNFKTIPYNDLKHITINSINAERDDFSESSSMKSNSILTRLLEKKLSKDEKAKIHEAYFGFFKEIKDQDNFKKIFTRDVEFPDLDRFVANIDCIPNLANLKNILSNITLAYGDEFLYQKGLGQRNIIFIILFFQHFKSNKSCFNLSFIEEPESHLSTNNLNLVIDYIKKSVAISGNLFQTIISSHSPQVINKLEFENVIAFSGNMAVSFKNVDSALVKYLSKRPNFDILKLLFSNRIILVEGTTEEMFINTILDLDKNILTNIDVISISQKGYKTFLEIWKKLNEGNTKKIGVIRDYDDQPNAKMEHDAYDNKKTIFVETTKGYTLEDDIVSTGNNCALISKHFGLNNDEQTVSGFLKSSKVDYMFDLCNAMQDGSIVISIPEHITSVLKNLQ
ncbi:ATP-dependent endonuclease [Sphingobacterium sp. PCS056]|uniref:ATP-dependent nuclease n=1 Tax=Sphingobacterium sp. PCS056 TaxID=2931400 RepID=UPI00200C92E2|nr:AAA family ATPase [Sphingobacterium sp. PCS056]UPZ35296.1 ATP-dependent endonuclease [Sphingobacterium sp. PCS056]